MTKKQRGYFIVLACHLFITELKSDPLYAVGSLCSFINRELEYDLMEAEDVSAETAARVQSILKKIDNMHGKPIYVKQIAPLLVKDFGRRYMFATHNTIHLNEDYFKTITKDEQEFLIGHEAGHIILHHPASMLIFDCSMIALGCILNMRAVKRKKTTFIGALVATTIIQSMSSLIRKAYKRILEKQADLYAVNRLGCHNGAIDFFSAENKKHTFLHRLFATHPLDEDRIAYVKKHQAHYSKKSV